MPEGPHGMDFVLEKLLFLAILDVLEIVQQLHTFFCLPYNIYNVFDTKYLHHDT